MRRLALVIVGFASVAHADDPRDVFGLKPKKHEAPLDCRDGREFGCAEATDPLVDDVPYALRTWFPSTYLLSLLTADATQVNVAGYAIGAGASGATRRRERAPRRSLTAPPCW